MDVPPPQNNKDEKRREKDKNRDRVRNNRSKDRDRDRDRRHKDKRKNESSGSGWWNDNSVTDTMADQRMDDRNKLKDKPTTNLLKDFDNKKRGRDDKYRDRDRDKYRDKDRHRDRNRDRDRKHDKDRDRDRNRDRDRDRHRDRNRDRDRDRPRNKDTGDRYQSSKTSSKSSRSNNSRSSNNKNSKYQINSRSPSPKSNDSEVDFEAFCKQQEKAAKKAREQKLKDNSSSASAYQMQMAAAKRNSDMAYTNLKFQNLSATDKVEQEKFLVKDEDIRAFDKNYKYESTFQGTRAAVAGAFTGEHNVIMTDDKNKHDREIKGVKNRVMAGIQHFDYDKQRTLTSDKDLGKVIIYTTSLKVNREMAGHCERAVMIIRHTKVPSNISIMLRFI